LLIKIPEDVLVEISKYIPDLLIFVAKITDLRGHGNKPDAEIMKDLKNNELLELKEKTYKIIKILLELLYA
jgi:hypothetical protein